MKQYHDLLKHVMDNGTDRSDRTGTGTRSVFGYQMRFNLQDGFPLMTTKKVYWKGVVYELLWFLKGDTNTKYLVDHNVHIWDEWANENGDLGRVYGAQWRDWRNVCGDSVDQIKNVIRSIQTNPDSRRHMVVAWNPGEIQLMALPPCHCLFQFYVANGELSCQLYQRSCDVFLGLPFNIASYSLLTHMIAKMSGLKVGEFVWTGGDIHIYHNHFDQVREQLSRKPRSLPRLEINKLYSNIEDYDYCNFGLYDYNPHPTIKAPIAV